MSSPAHLASEPFVISRVFDAPREMVWRAWTDINELTQWWGPKGVKIVSASLDLRPGGMFLYGMQSPDGPVTWGKFVYREIKAPEWLEFIVSFSDEHGGITRHPMMPTWPRETLSVVEFADRNGKTEVTVTWMPHNASADERMTFDGAHESMRQGWGGTMEQFAAYLANRT